MGKTELLKEYQQYKDLLSSYKKDDHSKEIQKELLTFIDNNLLGLIRGLVYTRLERNVKGESSRHWGPYSFMIAKEDIIKALSDPALITRIKDKLIEKINELIVNIPSLEKDNYEETNIFSTDVLLEAYSKTFRRYLFYFDYADRDVYDGYLSIYKRTLLPDLSQLYLKPSVNRQINIERFQLCAPENFHEENALRDPDFGNVRKVVDRFLTSVKEGRKIISDDEIILCYKAETVQRIINYSLDFKKPKIDVGTPTTTTGKSAVQEAEEEVRKSAVQILKGSVKQTEYVGFFTKDDYLFWISKKHPKVPKERIEAIFDSITTPKPPAGVTRFTIPATREHPKIIYFIALEQVPLVYQRLDKNKKGFTAASQISQRHFVLFLKKLLNDFTKVGYSNEKIASLLACSPSLVDTMRKNIVKFEK